MTRCVLPALLGAMLVMHAGCRGYHLAGTVIEGPTSVMTIVSDDDPRLKQSGIAGAVIELTLDPDTLRPKSLGKTVSGGDGSFELPVDQTGAGFLEYEVGVFVQRRGYRSLWEQMMLPKKSRRLLIIMEPGAGGDARPGGNILDETMRDGYRLMNE